MKHLTFYLANIRKEKGFTTRELAEICGISVRSIERIERGNVSPLLETMCKLAVALDVPVTDLFLYE